MNIRTFFGDVSIAIVAQGVSIGLNVITTLVLPKYLGVEEFGYWQLFLFYVTYVGFFHLGINDGVYLIKGGETRNKIDKSSVTGQFLFSISYQIIFSVALAIIAILGRFEEQRTFVVLATSASIVVINSALFLGYVFQAMNETRVFSNSTLVGSASFLICLAILLALKVSSFEPYIVCYCASKAMGLLYCLFKSKDMLQIKDATLKSTITESAESIRVGIKLMLANVASSLILGVVRFFVDLEWGIEVFSIVSFSLAIATFFLMFLTQVSMVLFPYLRQFSNDTVSMAFKTMRDGLNLFLPAIFVLYPLISILLNLWVPEYSESIALFIFLFPICVFDGKMDIVGATYFKVIRGESKLFALNIATLAVSALVTIAGTYVVHSVPFVLFSVALTLGLRGFAAESILAKSLNVSRSSLSWKSIILSCLFILANSELTLAFATCAYIGIYAIYLLMHRSIIKQLINDVSAISK